MEYYLVALVILSALVGGFARLKGRSEIAFFMISMIASPLISGLILSVVKKKK